VQHLSTEESSSPANMAVSGKILRKFADQEYYFFPDPMERKRAILLKG